MGREKVIEIIDFCKVYEHEIAVENLSLTAHRGEIIGLIGPNGAGKTTTMRALAGIIPGSQGKLKVGGWDVQRNPIEVKKQTAYVPDDPQLFNDLTVQEHFAFTAAAYEVTDWKYKMEQLTQSFDLYEKLNARASDLSRGMRQKLAICCAYLYEPKALLLDEPMTGLDPKGIRNLKSSIVEKAEQGAAILISSHLLAMVEDICTHALILDRGKKKFHGQLNELKAQFANRSDSTLEEVFFNAVSRSPVLTVDLPTVQPTTQSSP